MLDADYLSTIGDDVVKMYQQLEDDIVIDIARRISRMNYASSASIWQLEQMQEAGALYDDLIKKVAKKADISKSEVLKVFKDAGTKTLKFDDAIYKAVGLNPLPIAQSDSLLQILKAGAEKTGKDIKNITMTTVNASQQTFIDASSRVYMQVTSGAFDAKSAINNVVTDLAKNGIVNAFYASGVQTRVEYAIKRNLRTGANQTCSTLQLERAKEMGTDKFEVTAHIGSRPDHASWQGKVFTLEELYSICGLGTVEGLCGANCRHSYFPFFKGSEKAYNKKELEEMNNREVTYTGNDGQKKTISYYDATQKQRKLEAEIRKAKRGVDAKEASGLDSSLEKKKLSEWRKKTRSFIKDTGLDRDYFREKIYN